MKKAVVFSIVLLCGCLMGLASVSARSEVDNKDLVGQLKRVIQEMQVLSQPRPQFEPGVLADPMKPLIDEQGNLVKMPEKQQEGLMLQGVLWSGDFRTVLVNDKLYAAGDSIGAERIDEISSNGFFLVNDSTRQRRFVSLYEAATAKDDGKKLAS